MGFRDLSIMAGSEVYVRKRWEYGLGFPCGLIGGVFGSLGALCLDPFICITSIRRIISPILHAHGIFLCCMFRRSRKMNDAQIILDMIKL